VIVEGLRDDFTGSRQCVGVIVMFGMVALAATSMLSGGEWTQRNMLIFGVSLSIGVGLELEPGAVQHPPETLRIILTSGVLPAALLAVVLNLVVPHRPRHAVSAPDTAAVPVDVYR
jgi:NCS2 family nucleobase:cation symporter-2